MGSLFAARQRQYRFDDYKSDEGHCRKLSARCAIRRYLECRHAARGALSSTGVLYAIASGAVASGLGYAIWYAALPAIKATSAATIQLSVPVITALGGIIFLGEALTLRLTLASIAILGGVALAIFENQRKMQQ